LGPPLYFKNIFSKKILFFLARMENNPSTLHPFTFNNNNNNNNNNNTENRVKIINRMKK